MSLVIFHDIKQRSVATMLQARKRRASTRNVVGQQVRANFRPRGKNNGAFNNIFYFADVAGP